MGAREELEASLQARWSRDELAVYADALMAEGDVRGELIALDLHREPRPRPIARSRQRLALLARWLGEELAESAYDLTRYGFLDTCRDVGKSLLVPLLDRASPHVRSLDFIGYSHPELRGLIEKLAGEPRPWLVRLAITLNDEWPRPGPIIDDDLAARLIAATPRLVDLEIEARDLFAAFPHPAVTRLRSSHRGIRTLAGDNTVALPAVTELDLALSERFDQDHEALDPDDAVRLLPRAALPALARLDLSRNEPGLLLPFHRGFDFDHVMLRIVGRWPICAQLTHLRVPALHGKADLDELTGLLARMPALVELEVARGYSDMAQLLPRLAELPRVRAPRWLWPWPHRFPPGDLLVFDGLPIKAQSLAAALELHYDAIPEAARDAWSRLWVLAGSMHAPEARPFPRADLEAAVRALAEVPGSLWGELGRHLADARLDADDPDTVEIGRRVG